MTDTTGRPPFDEHVKRIVDEAPPLTNEQRDRLSLILQPVRAIDDPVTLNKAARIIRTAMERQTPEAKRAAQRSTHPAAIRARKQGLA